MTKRKGFTLIELLVVVAIIALLIAILLPSLAKAKEKAVTVRCLANLKALTQGAISYATEWDQQLPNTRGQPDACTSAGTYQMNNGSTLLSFGLLYFGKSITDPRVYYCPAQQNTDFMLNPSFTSGPAWLAKNKAVQGGRIGYQFQVHMSSFTTGTNGTGVMAYPKYSQYPSSAIMGCDILWGTTDIAHGSSALPAKTFFNASFSDGHAQSITNPAVVGALSSQWGDSTTAPKQGIVPCVTLLEAKSGL